MVQTRAHATPLAGVGDKKIVSALTTVGAGKAVSSDAAFEIAAKGVLDIGRRRRGAGLRSERQPGLEVRWNCGIQKRELGMTALIALGADRHTVDGANLDTKSMHSGVSKSLTHSASRAENPLRERIASCQHTS